MGLNNIRLFNMLSPSPPSPPKHERKRKALNVDLAWLYKFDFPTPVFSFPFFLFPLRANVLQQPEQTRKLKIPLLPRKKKLAKKLGAP